MSEIYVDRLKRDLVGAFRRFQEGGFLEIITCAATHGFLPLLASQPEAVRAQIRIACDQYANPSAAPLKESGYRNVPISPEWKNTFEKPKFAGLSWMRMD